MSRSEGAKPSIMNWRTEDKELAKLQLVLGRLLRNREGLRVLEAGCGSASRVSLGQSAYVVGIDISAEQLRKNSLLNERILGDVQTYDLTTDKFDMIVCWDVLEHLPQPHLCLKNFVRSLAEGGVIVLAVPNVLSVKGLLAKFTPHWFHVWVYRSLYGTKAAGTAGCAPFRAFMKPSIASASLKRFADKHGLLVEYLSMYESEKQRMLRYKFGITSATWASFKLLVRTVTLGRVDAELTDCVIVLSKQAALKRVNGASQAAGELDYNP